MNRITPNKFILIIIIAFSILLSACTGGTDECAQGETINPDTDKCESTGLLPAGKCSVAKITYKNLEDIHKYIISRTCAFEMDACHFDEDPPPMHTVGLFHNSINMPCNTGVPEEIDMDSFCRNEGGVIIKPGNANESYLMMRLRGDPRTTRPSMPLDAQSISREELYVIEAWINGLSADGANYTEPINYSLTRCPLDDPKEDPIPEE